MAQERKNGNSDKSMTAVEWLQIKMATCLTQEMVENINVWFKEAKQMEKEQIMKSFKSSKIPYKYDANLTLNGFEDAEQYYNETYGKE